MRGGCKAVRLPAEFPSPVSDLTRLADVLPDHMIISSYTHFHAIPPSRFACTRREINSKVIHSNGGSDGCRFTRSLLAKLDRLLKPTGRAMIFSLQIEGTHGPILAAEIREGRMNRSVEMMRTTDCYIAFEMFVRCLMSAVAVQKESILEWSHGLQTRHGNGLTINWYLIHVGPQGLSQAECAVTDFDEEKYGQAYAPRPLDHRRRIQTLVDLEIFR